MRLLYIIDDIFSTGGTQRVTLMKANYFADRCGFEVHIVVRDKSEAPPAFPLSDRVRVHHNPVSVTLGGRSIPGLGLTRGIVSFSRSIRCLVSRLRPDVVITVGCDPVESFLPFLCGSAAVVREYHYSRRMQFEDWNSLPPVSRFYTRSVDRFYTFFNRFYDRFVVLTAADRDLWGGSSARVIPNPVTLPADSAFSKSDIPLRVIAVGRYVYHKGFDRLLHAWSLVALRFPGWRLDLFGPGSPRSLSALSVSLGIAASGTFHPAVSDIASEYARSALFALPSRFEGFGLVLAEAMACGLPAVSFDCPSGPAEIITSGSDGILVPDADIQAFSDALASLMADAPLRHRLGDAARTNMRRYAADTVFSAWLALFKELKPDIHVNTPCR